MGSRVRAVNRTKKTDGEGEGRRNSSGSGQHSWELCGDGGNLRCEDDTPQTCTDVPSCSSNTCIAAVKPCRLERYVIVNKWP